jgi:hypothetical protein
MRALIIGTTILVLNFTAIAQQDQVEVKRFEYLYSKQTPSARSARIALIENDTVRKRISQSFTRALNTWKGWHLQNDFDVKGISHTVDGWMPKFNTKLKDKAEGNSYLFLQVYEEVNSTASDNDYALVSIIHVRCRIVRDISTFERNLTVFMQRRSAPAGQQILNRLPAYPEDYLSSFDSVASWAFTSAFGAPKTSVLLPACIYLTTSSSPKENVSFLEDGMAITPSNSWSMRLTRLPPKFIQESEQKKIAGNAAKSIVTVLTGVGTNKHRFKNYRTDLGYADAEKSYHALIHFTEMFASEQEREKQEDGWSTVNSTDFSTVNKWIDSTSMHHIVSGGDTLCAFQLSYKAHPVSDTSKLMWNGKDSSTIIDLPVEWNNTGMQIDIQLVGAMSGSPFIMKSSGGMRVKSFYKNEQLTATFTGNDRLESAALYSAISPTDFKLMTILSAISYKSLLQ